MWEAVGWVSDNQQKVIAQYSEQQATAMHINI